MDLTLPLSKEVTEFIIPQKQPFVLVSTLFSIDEHGCKTGFRIPSGHVLVDNGLLQPSGLLENIAQSCALMMGYSNAKRVALAHGAETPQPKVGFIGDIREFSCNALPEIEGQLETYINIENQVFDVTMIEGKVFYQNQLIASCKMKIFVKN